MRNDSVKFIDIAKNNTETFILRDAGTYVMFLYNASADIEIVINGEGIAVFLYGLYIGTEDNQFQLHVKQVHNKGKNSSSSNISGVFYDHAALMYHGQINITKNASETIARLHNKNILQSEACKVEAKPTLEIAADDVSCTHGVSTGKLSDEDLYYMKTRGLDKMQASKLLLTGFVNEVFTSLSQHGIDQKIQQYKQEAFELLAKNHD